MLPMKSMSHTLPLPGWPRVAVGLLLLLPLLLGVERMPPLTVDILGPEGTLKGRAQVYSNYVELQDAGGQSRGAIGVVVAQGRLRLFLVRGDAERSLVGWSDNHRLYNANNELLGYYNWSAIWSVVYDPKLRPMGRAQCIAYQGVCAAGVAGFLLGLY